MEHVTSEKGRDVKTEVVKHDETVELVENGYILASTEKEEAND